MIGWHLPLNLNFFYTKGELKHLFLSGVARRITLILLALFSPVYIFQSAVALGATQSQAIIYVLSYFLLVYLTKIISLSISEDLSRRIGFKGTIWASSFPFFLFIPSIVFAAKYPILFLAAGILWGIHAGLFWWGYHGYFIKTGEKKHFGHSIGEAKFLETLAGVLTPFVGAILISLFGFSALFIFAGFVMVASLALLGKDHDKRQKRDIKFISVVKLLFTHKSITLAYAGTGAETVIYMFIWPIFLFLFFGQVVSLGIVVSLSSLIAALFALGVGDKVDRQGERKIVGVGSPLLFISWIIRTIKSSTPFFILADSVWNFGQRMVVLPLIALSYKKALEAESAKAILFREMAITLGQLASFLTIIAWIAIGGSISGSFVIAAIFSLFPLVSVFKRRIKDAND